MQLICNRHGVSNHRLSGTKWKCKKCEYFYSRRYLENIKLKAVKYGGGECQKCGYDKCWRAFNFHHIDPSKKNFGIFESRPGFKKVRNWEMLRSEIDKCIMLCANCHAEIHANDDRILHEELDLRLSRLKIELLNKSIIEGRKSAQDVFYSL